MLSIANIPARLGGRYATPFQMPYPAKVALAAKLYAVRALYTRRGKADANPYKKQAEDMDADLAQIAAGTLPLDPRVQRANPSASVRSTPSKTAPAGTTSV